MSNATGTVLVTVRERERGDLSSSTVAQQWRMRALLLRLSLLATFDRRRWSSVAMGSGRNKLQPPVLLPMDGDKGDVSPRVLLPENSTIANAAAARNP
jgi:hypothetical protein